MQSGSSMPGFRCGAISNSADIEYRSPCPVFGWHAPGLEAEPQRLTRPQRRSMHDIHQIDATVLRPCALVVAVDEWFFLAEAHGFQLAFGHAKGFERAHHGFRALLAKREVVFRRA